MLLLPSLQCFFASIAHELNYLNVNEKLASGYRVPDFVKPADSLFDLIKQAKQFPVLTSQQLDTLRSVTNAKIDQQIQNIKIHCLHLC